MGNTPLIGILRATFSPGGFHGYDQEHSFKATIEFPAGDYSYQTLEINISSIDTTRTTFKCNYWHGEWIGAPCSVKIKGGDLGDFPSGPEVRLTEGVTYDMVINF